MTAKEFDVILERRLDLIRRVIGSKAIEYATAEDRMHNFKEAAKLQKCQPARALLGMLMKHVVSVSDMVLAGEWGQRFTPEQWDEKLGDAINYLCLLEGLVVEARS